MAPFISPLWAQGRNAIGELIQLLFVLLLIVVPAIIKFFSEQAAKKERQRLGEQEAEEQLRAAFSTPEGEEIDLEELIVQPKPKPTKKRKSPEPVLGNTSGQPVRGTPLVRELAPQGEGYRFVASPGTFDGTQTLTPGVEPTVQPMLESLTGIYDAPPGSDQSVPSPFAAGLASMLTSPSGLQQAVVLGEIFKRPEF